MEQIDCMSCGTQTNARRFENESFAIEYGGAKATVDGLSGGRCVVCDEKVFEPDSAWRYAASSDDLVLRHRKDTQNEIRRIQRKLGPSKAAAARLTGGGHNALSRYERGEATPLPAVTNLFKLLDHHPELLQEIV